MDSQRPARRHRRGPRRHGRQPGHPYAHRDGGLTVDPGLNGTRTYLVNYVPQSDGTTLRIQPRPTSATPVTT
ncbi:hypothetical protein M0638_25620 [Roseomonas sp. NAR14]|uniref:Uncharacterized protein n=1 Tax=Roseomonas acroporae TaxID=2937791 RepID=A0A9X1YCQ3_9PROT|nr:hypothetical protein [Roseomonas acroporae]MCK8787743.1 hypothetical protein [Roseomonas acroporae]